MPIYTRTGDEGETDIIAVREGFVSLTPIWFDLTHESAMDFFRKNWDGGLLA